MVAAFLRKFIDQKMIEANLKENLTSPEQLFSELRKIQITELQGEHFF
jgi:hypothetical protein